MFFKPNKQELKRSLENLEKAQAILDERYEKKQMTIEAYQKQCIEFGKRREKLRKSLGEDIFDDIIKQ